MSDSLRVPSGTPNPQNPGEDPLYYYNRILVRFLQTFFGAFDPGYYHWDLDQALTEIFISDQATLGHDAIEKRPAILVARGPMAFGNLALDQFNGPLLKTDAKTGQQQFTPNEDGATGRRRYTDLVSASASLNVLSSVGVEAQRIAWMCAKAVRVYKRTLMQSGFHRIGEEAQVGAESSPGAIVQPDPKEITMVSVSIPFFFQDFWSTEPVDKVLLKKMDLALRSKVNFAPGERPLNAPAMNGKTLQYDRERSISLTQRVNLTKDKTPKPR